jgi:mRNA interferase MazF
MLKPGDVVIVDFFGAEGNKRRPAVVVSSEEYQRQRPDVILGILTSNVGSATASTDHVLRNWQAASLRVPSAFRAYLVTHLATSVKRIGHLEDSDWQTVQDCVHRALT